MANKRFKLLLLICKISCMGGPPDCHTEWSQSDRMGNTIWHLLYVDSKNKWYKWTYRTETGSQT